MLFRQVLGAMVCCRQTIVWQEQTIVWWQQTIVWSGQTKDDLAVHHCHAPLENRRFVVVDNLRCAACPNTLLAFC
ncbi:hypothetical protein [Alloprevotella tannerae]|uniref:hypothetical protein n=1 Tax=Alloprevotella tannerae TaxID=76122 RepID=UPI001CAB7993|nr:hypothetical protein [Alloprevotella tannerae]MBF0952371.1 hypothetical protein [Alloprevotella tannerae]